MKAIGLPKDLDPMQYFDAIVDGKYAVKGHKTKLQAIRPIIKAAFCRYYENRAQLEIMAPDSSIDAAGRKALASCWSESDAFSQLKRDVQDWLGPENDRCPLCGIGDAYDTFEHYLPKAKDRFPEFIICAYNIIPCCSQCNFPRPWKNDAGERLLLHVYFDAIDENTAYLSATIEMDEPHPRAEYSVEPHPSGSDDFLEAYSRHFDKLKLADRFRRHSRSYLRGVANDLRSYRDYPLASYRRSLHWKADAEAQALGANHFEVATLRAAAASDEFIRYAITRGTP